MHELKLFYFYKDPLQNCVPEGTPPPFAPAELVIGGGKKRSKRKRRKQKNKK